MASPLLMPVSCEVERTVLVLRLVGTYSPTDVRAAIGAALAEPGRPQLTGLVADLRYSESIATRTLADLTAIIGFLAYHSASLGNRIAIVAPESGDDTLLNMASVDLRTGGVDAVTFRDMSEARTWISR
ncbi:MAG TPA: hypothetical protein VG432_07885 [Gemmatimonadaceae bacterium]|nr:hypothetical protein [Gemmatimonadaceae bacterium]